MTGNNEDLEALASPRQQITACGQVGVNAPLCGVHFVTPCYSLAFSMTRKGIAQSYVTYRIAPTTVYTLEDAILSYPGVTLESTSSQDLVDIDCNWEICVTAAANDVSFTRLRMWHGMPAILVKPGIGLITLTECTILNSRDGDSHMGAGMTVMFNAEVYIRGCLFHDLVAGGDGAAIFASFADVYIDDTFFDNCTCGGNGGAIYAYSSSLMMRGVELSRSYAVNGGAISVERGNFNCYICIMEHNLALLSGGSLFIKQLSPVEDSWMNWVWIRSSLARQGGAMWIENSKMSMIDIHMLWNDAIQEGGAIISTDSRLDIRTSLFARNSRGSAKPANADNERNITSHPLYKDDLKIEATPAISRGGAIVCLASPSSPQPTWLRINNSAFIDNQCDNEAGAIYISKCPLTMDNTLVVKNHATNKAGAIYAVDSNPTTITNTLFEQNVVRVGDGGVMVSYGTRLVVKGSNFTMNSAINGGGSVIYWQEYRCAPLIQNCTFIENINAYGTAQGLATPPAALHIVSPSQHSSHISGQPMNPTVIVALVDEYNQPTAYGGTNNGVDISAAVQAPAILGGTLTFTNPLKDGYYYFNSSSSAIVLVGRGGIQGYYMLTFIANVPLLRGGSQQAVAYLRVNISVCQPGEYQAIDRCVPCAAGWYSDTVNVTECQRCPAG
jgi:hypothetical protein